MAEIINLRQQRKARLRAERAAQAATNRAQHGRSKDERQRQQAETERDRRRLDGLRLDERHPGDDRPGRQEHDERD